MLAIAESNIDQEIEQLLAEDRAKSLLRFTTAGSVDDGKSTLIGRLLYDSKNVFEEQPMLLGADFLRAHRTLVSHSQRKMYFTYVGGPVFVTGRTKPPAQPPSGDKPKGD